MATIERKMIPIEEGLWTIPSKPGEEPHLIGTKCLSCGEMFFPKLLKKRCVHCYSSNMEDVPLSRKGKLRSFTVVQLGPGGTAYHGPVPYALAYVDLTDGTRVETHLAGDFNSYKVGMEMELVIEKLYENAEGNEVMTFKFKPVAK